MGWYQIRFGRYPGSGAAKRPRPLYQISVPEPGQYTLPVTRFTPSRLGVHLTLFPTKNNPIVSSADLPPMLLGGTDLLYHV